jgi:hypothetical protein
MASLYWAFCRYESPRMRYAFSGGFSEAITAVRGSIARSGRPDL